jgi:hypothetical protein
MDIKIIVATHKPYWMPEDEVYLPVHVGHFGKEDIGYTADDTGIQISEKNKNYCELTGLYWAWKNLPSEYLGLAHYRRHFAKRGFLTEKKARVFSKKDFENALAKADVLLPRPRNYYIETNYDQYVHAHHKEDLDRTLDILTERYPEYVPAFERSMKRTTGHRFNMFVMKRSLADQYCQWLFDILFELEKRLDISSYNDYDARVYGFVAERLLDVWLETNHINYIEIPYVFLEQQNWLTKGFKFVKRKFNASK